MKLRKEKEIDITKPATFTKEQIVGARKYDDFRDFLSGNLEDGKEYTVEAVDKMLKQKGLMK